MGQLEIQHKLNEVFANLQEKNPAFSMRSFSQRLSLSPSALSEILRGKRRISEKMATKIVDKLNLPPTERISVLNQFSKTSRAPTESLQYLQLAEDQFRYISEWQHFAILSLLETSCVVANPSDVVKKINLSENEAMLSLARLERLKLIRRSTTGRYRTTGIRLRTPDGINHSALRRNHHTNLELAQASLERDSIERRDFTAITMAICPEKLPEAKTLIRKFQDELSLLLEQSPKTAVYKCCVQLFPLTNNDGDKNEVH